MNLWEQFKKAIAIAKKDLAIYYFRGSVIIQGLLIPAFLFISFSFKRDVPLTFLLSGLLGMAIFFAVSAITPVIAPWETRMKTFERLVSSPVCLWAIILGDIMASVIFGLLVTFFVLLAAIFLLGIQIINIYLIVGIIIAAFCFSVLGVLISAPPADKPSDIMVFATLIKFPFVFISGVFTPITELGKFKILSFISPLTYFVDLTRYSIDKTNLFSPLFNLIILFIITIILFIISVKWHEKNLNKRF